MPTSLPERRQPEFTPSLRQIVAFSAALVVLVGLIASHAPVIAWVNDVGPAEFVSSDTPELHNPARVPSAYEQY